MNASKLGSSGLGIVFKGGIVFAVEKKLNSNLVERQGFDKICEIDTHINCIVSGLIADSQKLLETAAARLNATETYVNYATTVVGTHVGPGTLGLIASTHDLRLAYSMPRFSATYALTTCALISVGKA